MKCRTQYITAFEEDMGPYTLSMDFLKTPIEGRSFINSGDGLEKIKFNSIENISNDFTATVAQDGNSILINAQQNLNGNRALRISFTNGSEKKYECAFNFIIKPINDAPYAFDATFQSDDIKPVSGFLSGGDVDGYSDEASTEGIFISSRYSISIVTPPTYGTVRVLSGGLFEYAWTNTQTAEDSFNWKIDSSVGLNQGSQSAQARVTVIKDANLKYKLPVAQNRYFQTLEDIGLNIRPNLVSPLNQPVELLYVFSNNGRAQKYVEDNIPNIDFYPKENFNGTAHVNLVIRSGEFQTVETVAVEVQSVYDKPYLLANEIRTTRETPVTFKINYSKADADNITLSIEIQPLFGNAVLDNDTINYTPNADVTGNDTIGIKIIDSSRPDMFSIQNANIHISGRVKILNVQGYVGRGNFTRGDTACLSMYPTGFHCLELNANATTLNFESINPNLEFRNLLGLGYGVVSDWDGRGYFERRSLLNILPNGKIKELTLDRFYGLGWARLLYDQPINNLGLPPAAIENLSEFNIAGSSAEKIISGGQYASTIAGCIITKDKQLYCWGRVGNLGTGATTGWAHVIGHAKDSVRVAFPANTKVKDARITRSKIAACADTDSGYFCWGFIKGNYYTIPVQTGTGWTAETEWNNAKPEVYCTNNDNVISCSNLMTNTTYGTIEINQ